MEQNKQNYAEPAEPRKREAEPAEPRGMLCKTSRTASNVRQNQQDRANVGQIKQNYAEPSEPHKRGAEAADRAETMQNQQNRVKCEEDPIGSRKRAAEAADPFRTSEKYYFIKKIMGLWVSRAEPGQNHLDRTRTVCEIYFGT